MKSDVESGRAISIKQPFVEEILRGIKKYEYRSRSTKIRGRVYLYASLRPREDGNWKRLKMNLEDVPNGAIVGSVEIVDCIYFEDKDIYGYKLKNPKRYKNHLKPKNRPQPCFFFPFGSLRNKKNAQTKSSPSSKERSKSVRIVRNFNKSLKKFGIKSKLPVDRKSVTKLAQKSKGFD